VKKKRFQKYKSKIFFQQNYTIKKLTEEPLVKQMIRKFKEKLTIVE